LLRHRRRPPRPHPLDATRRRRRPRRFPPRLAALRASRPQQPPVRPLLPGLRPGAADLHHRCHRIVCGLLLLRLLFLLSFPKGICFSVLSPRGSSSRAVELSSAAALAPEGMLDTGFKLKVGNEPGTKPGSFVSAP